MKLAKQIILLSAALVLAMGLSFTLISGIVIGSQTSVKEEKLEAAIAYTDARTPINATYETAKETHKTNVAAAKTTRDAVLNDAASTDEQKKAANDKYATDVAAYDKTLATAKKTYNAAVLKAQRDRDSEIAAAKKAAFHAAFYYTKSTTTLTDAGQRTATSQAFTPMGCLMVTGLAFTFIGGGLVLTVVLLNKNEGKKQPSQAKKAA